jgi:hypothetical protein
VLLATAVFLRPLRLSRAGAQGIDYDPLWEVYLALEGEGAEMKVAGFGNVYRFYHYPDSTRLRISQVDVTFNIAKRVCSVVILCVL